MEIPEKKTNAKSQNLVAVNVSRAGCAFGAPPGTRGVGGVPVTAAGPSLGGWKGKLGAGEVPSVR